MRFCFGVLLLLSHFVNIILLDLALNQPAAQVSEAHGGKASRAVDGNKNTAWEGNSCMHTNLEKDPWWRVDLGASLHVAEVVIVNRLCGGCGNDMNAFEIRIGKAILNFTLLFKTYKQKKKHNSLEVSNATQTCHTDMKHVYFVKFSLKGIQHSSIMLISFFHFDIKH